MHRVVGHFERRDHGGYHFTTVYKWRECLRAGTAAAVMALVSAHASGEELSVARRWNEVTLEAIRNDFARPPLHARNLYHLSVAMWDAWAVYDTGAGGSRPRDRPILADERVRTGDVAASRNEAISYAAYRVLVHRYRESPGAEESLPSFDALLAELGYHPSNETTRGNSAAAVGNRAALRVIRHGLADGADELGDYAFDNGYEPVNPPLFVALPGAGELADPNRWQPLSLLEFIDQAGRRQAGNVQRFIGSHWGEVTPFALPRAALAAPGVYHDPGAPPYLRSDRSAEYRDAFAEVVRFSATLDPDDGVLMDIGPGALGGNSLGANDGRGYARNPVTGRPYAANVVKRGDWTRVIAEFWADGPDSETPPGHWNTLANYVTDHPQQRRLLRGAGAELAPLEWDVKLYLALNGALHDAAVAAWGIKGHYDYVRPITAIRFMAQLGQSSDPSGPAYHPHGLPLEPGLIEVITPESAAAGERHAHLADHVGEIAVYAWRGRAPSVVQRTFNRQQMAASVIPEVPVIKRTPPRELTGNDYWGAGWIRATEWLPYQRDSFVTPPFAGYVSGHSTFSRAAAEVLARFTGSAFFPGGLGEFTAPANEFLVFETGPSETIRLQWATYYDAADEAAISRLYGGIHPSVDDLPGRILGARVGSAAFNHALALFGDN